MASIEGERGMPRPRPPFPAVKGLWGLPDQHQQRRDLRQRAPHHQQRPPSGSPRWAPTQQGHQGLRGHRQGASTRPRRSSDGHDAARVIYEICGGIAEGRKFKAVQTGGPSGGCIPAELLDTPVDYESLIKAGAMMGSGGLVVMDETTCMVDVARFFLSFMQDESCGKCVPCRIGRSACSTSWSASPKGAGKEATSSCSRWDAPSRSASCGLGRRPPTRSSPPSSTSATSTRRTSSIDLPRRRLCRTVHLPLPERLSGRASMCPATSLRLPPGAARRLQPGAQRESLPGHLRPCVHPPLREQVPPCTSMGRWPFAT